MANEPEQVEIEIEQPAAAEKKDEIEVVKVEESSKKDDLSTEDGIEALRRQLEEERSARIAAENAANAAKQHAYKAQNEVADTNLHLINNAIESVKVNTQNLKAAYAQAMAAGDYDSAADIQQTMAENSAKLLQLEQGKQALEEAPKPQAPAPVQSDPVEALASQLSPRSAQWVRAHPEYARNPNLYRKMIAAHELAVADGLEADTNDYFDSIEATLRIRQNAAASSDASADAAKVTQRRTAPPAAPVSRSGNAGTGNRPNVVRLTSDEREMAKMMGMTDQEYAKNKLALQREGKLN
jgi:hypothetical protein